MHVISVTHAATPSPPSPARSLWRRSSRWPMLVALPCVRSATRWRYDASVSGMPPVGLLRTTKDLAAGARPRVPPSISDAGDHWMGAKQPTCTHRSSLWYYLRASMREGLRAKVFARRSSATPRSRGSTRDPAPRDRQRQLSRRRPARSSPRSRGGV